MFTRVSTTAFDELQVDAGIVLKNFDPTNPVEPADEDIICATTGGINPTCVPTYSDWGEDVDNVPNGMLELNHLDGWDCGMGFTAIGSSEELIRLTLGAADVGENGQIVPRRNVKVEDYNDLWWVGDRSDGGFVAICLKNALSTGGFSLQTTKNGKGQIAVDLKGFVSVKTQDEMPMEIYVSKGTEETATEE